MSSAAIFFVESHQHSIGEIYLINKIAIERVTVQGVDVMLFIKGVKLTPGRFKIAFRFYWYGQTFHISTGMMLNPRGDCRYVFKSTIFHDDIFFATPTPSFGHFLVRLFVIERVWKRSLCFDDHIFLAFFGSVCREPLDKNFSCCEPVDPQVAIIRAKF